MPPTLAPPRGPEPDATRDLRTELKRVRSPFNPMAPLLESFERYLTAVSRREESLEHRICDLERTVADQADLLQRQAERINGLMPPGEFITDEQFALMQGVGELKESAIDRMGAEIPEGFVPL